MHDTCWNIWGCWGHGLWNTGCWCWQLPNIFQNITKQTVDSSWPKWNHMADVHMRKESGNIMVLMNEDRIRNLLHAERGVRFPSELPCGSSVADQQRAPMGPTRVSLWTPRVGVLRKSPLQREGWSLNHAIGEWLKDTRWGMTNITTHLNWSQAWRCMKGGEKGKKGKCPVH